MNHREHFQILYDNYSKAFTRFDDSVKSLLVPTGDQAGLKRLSSQLEYKLDDLGHRSFALMLYRSMLIFVAQHFSPSQQVPVDIDEMLLRSFHPYESGPFQPEALWRALESKYGRNQASESVYQEVARTLINSFSLSANQVPITKGGYIQLSTSISLDALDKAYGKKRISTFFDERLRNLQNALSTFFHWADLKEEMNTFNHIFQEKITCHSAEIVSGKKHVVSNNLYLATFNTSIRFMVSGHVGALLSAFLQQYGADDLARACA